MLALIHVGSAADAFHLLLALACCFMLLAFFVAKLRHRDLKWRRAGKMSIASQIAIVVWLFVWGTASLDSAFGWGLFVGHEVAAYLVPIGFAFATNFYDHFSYLRRRGE